MPRQRNNSLPIPVIGLTVNRWTFLHFTGKRGTKNVWLCQCSCGIEKEVVADNIVRGFSRSCGCFKREFPGAKTHGHTETPEYRSWASMLNRCNNPKGEDFHLYGGRGIKVCEEWHDFSTFLKDMGSRPANKSLDRFPDKNGDYTKNNCRWATQEEQCNNQRKNRVIEHDGQVLSASQWARKLGVSVTTIIGRMNAGYSASHEILFGKGAP